MLRRLVREVSWICVVAVFLVWRIESCLVSLQNGWKEKSVEEHANRSSIAVVGKVIGVYVIESSKLHNKVYEYADVQLLEVLKGRNITDQMNANLGSSLFRIYGFGSPTVCLSPVTRGETYLLFAMFEPTTLSLVAAYNTAFGATALPTRENRDRVLASQGWGPWSDWSSCSTTCGGGWQTRSRKCLKSRCQEATNEKRSCNKYNCRGVKNLLTYFVEKLRRNPRSIPPPQHRNAFRITNTGNLSVPTHRIYWDTFPEDFSMFASARFVNYTNGYLVSFYDSLDRLQIGIKISKHSVSLEYSEMDDPSKPVKKFAFEVEVVDSNWHQFAFSVQNGLVTFYLDCTIIGTQQFKQNRQNSIDTNGNVYLSGKTAPPRVHGENIEFYIEELSISDDARAGREQCETINDPYGYESESSGSGENPDENNENAENFGYEWASWTSCSQTCGDHGVRKRVKILKMCKNRVINATYSECMRALQVAESEACNRKTCPAHCQQYCMNGGVCIAKNKCQCRPQFEGVSCEKVKPCQLKCENGGRCVQSLGTCKCPKGYSGKLCQKATCHPPCEHGGICTKPGVCKCREGYLPPLCKPSCFPPCKNKGVCLMPGRCHCMPGYYGNRCERAICKMPCLNGGRCYNRNKCNCKSGWTGRTCNQAICHPKCQNGGYCRAPNLCSCPNETSGRYCQNVVCYPRCLNGGNCVKGNGCICSHWYNGRRCQTPVCNPKCQNGGQCVAPNQCVCPSGYFGDSCERRSCIYKTRVVPQKRTHLIPITTTYSKKCYHHLVWRPCTEKKTEYRVVHVTSYRTTYYCG